MTQGLLAAYDALLDPLRLGHPDIPYRKVAATAAHRRPGLLGGSRRRAAAGPSAASRRRPGPAHHQRRAKRRRPRMGRRRPGRRHRRSCCPRRPGLVRLAETARWAPPVLSARRHRRACSHQPPGRPGAGRPPGRRRAGRGRGHRKRVRVPEARHWLRLLEALEQPASRPRAVAVALTPFVGMTADDVAGGRRERRGRTLHARLHRWADILRRRGVATATRAILADRGTAGRLLLQPTGERDLTDLGHVAELLHAEASTASSDPLPCGPG